MRTADDLGEFEIPPAVGATCHTPRMALIDPLLPNHFLRKLIWKCWYPFLTRRLKGEEILFLNYAFETEPPMGLPLSEEDEPNRACIQLYHRTANMWDRRLLLGRFEKSHPSPPPSVFASSFKGRFPCRPS